MNTSGHWWDETDSSSSDRDESERESSGDAALLSITRWRSLTNTRGTKTELSWDALRALLAEPQGANGQPTLGWSAASFRDDRRAKEGVLVVTALVLDVDRGNVPLAQLREAFAGRRAIVHSTRSHAPGDARWRIVVAISRPMTPDEHARVWAVERDRLAQHGIHVDEQTKDASRFWFLPCPAADGSFTPGAFQGEPVDVDPTDAASAGARELRVSRDASSGDAATPSITLESTESSEVASISPATRRRRAAAYLEKAEVAVSGDGGHAITMRVVTAVVRGFALKSADALAVLDSWNARCEPPWSPSELAHKVDEAMRVGRVAWGSKLAARTSGATAGADSSADRTVLALLDKKGKQLRKSPANVMTILRLDARWRDVVAYDAFREAPILLGQPPQREHDAIAVARGDEWSPQDSTRTAAWLMKAYGLDVSSGVVQEAMLAVAQLRQIHPVRDYLAALEWDRQPRIETFFPAYCGTIDAEYTRGVARMLFVSAIARVMRPSSKVDTIPIIEGPQGSRKSSALRALAGPEWFADTPLAIGDKDAYQALRGVWIYELAELAALKGRDATRIKSFASSPSDHYRPSYEPRARTVERQCVFVGTTNEAHYLTDATGARRFWPVRISSINLAAIERDRDQLWAEARARFESGEEWWPSSRLAELGADAQDERYEGDPWDAPLTGWLGRPVEVRIDAEHRRHEVPFDPSEGLTMAEVLAHGVGVPIERQGKAEQSRAARALERAGWRRGKQERTVAGGRVRKWFPQDASHEAVTTPEADDDLVTGAGDT